MDLGFDLRIVTHNFGRLLQIYVCSLISRHGNRYWFIQVVVTCVLLTFLSKPGSQTSIKTKRVFKTNGQPPLFFNSITILQIDNTPFDTNIIIIELSEGFQCTKVRIKGILLVFICQVYQISPFFGLNKSDHCNYLYLSEISS